MFSEEENPVNIFMGIRMDPCGLLYGSYIGSMWARWQKVSGKGYIDLVPGWDSKINTA